MKNKNPTTHNSLLQSEINIEGKEGGKRKLTLSKFTSSCPNPTFALKGWVGWGVVILVGSLQHEMKQPCTIYNIKVEAI